MSPPCTEYSRANTKPLHRRDFETADALVQVGIDIIRYLKPPVHWMENPSTGKLPHRQVAEPFGKPYVVHYCKYYTAEEDKQVHKPTALWTNCEYFEPLPLCFTGARCEFMKPCGKQHTHSIRKGTTMTLAQRMRIPRELCKAIMEASIKQVHANWERLRPSGSSVTSGSVTSTSASLTSGSAESSA